MDHNDVGHIALAEVKTVHAKMNLIDAALVPLLPKALVDDWHSVSATFRNRSMERNVLAHGV